MKTNRLLLFVLFVLLSSFAQAQVAQMGMTATFSNTTPVSGTVFTLDVTVSSQALEDVGMLEGTKLEFTLPPNVEILALPSLSDSLLSVEINGNKHDVIKAGGPIPVWG